jgi:hypothetical protein
LQRGISIRHDLASIKVQQVPCTGDLGDPSPVPNIIAILEYDLPLINVG